MKKSNKFIIPLVAFLSSLVTAIITAIITLLITFIILAFIALTVTLSITLSDPCKKGHAWDEGVVTTASTCGAEGVMTFTCTNKKCEETKTKAIPATRAHTFIDATCEAAKTCSVCQATDGEAIGHKWVDATCEAPKTCSVCNATDGEAIGHKWVDATCEAPKTCSVCNATDGEALGHTFAATEDFVVVEGVAYVVEACACGTTQNVKNEAYVVVTDAANLVIESGKIYILGETAMGTITLTGELTNVTFIGGEFAAIVVGDATIDGLTIKDASFATEGGVHFFNKDNAAVVKNVVFDGCKFDGTNLSNNVINIWTDVENLTVNACEFKNLGFNTIPVMLNGLTLGEVNITNNVIDNFDQRFVRVANAQTGTITITGNTLTNWVNTSEDSDIIKATNTTATYVVENNTLDGEALGALEADGTNLVVKVDKTNEEETPDYVAPTPDPEDPIPVDPDEPTDDPELPEETPDEFEGIPDVPNYNLYN